MEMLPAERYPWGVCHSWYAEFSQQEIEWTREAMQIWNTKYLEYVQKKWGTLDVVNIPTGKLFIESCDSDRYNILYTGKKYLSDARAYYSARDDWWDFTNFHGILVFASNIDWADTTKWTKTYFINVMLHELGHVLGIPHGKTRDTSIMGGYGYFGCFHKEDICNLLSWDFETFIEPFSGIKTTRENLRIIEEERIRLLNHANNICEGDFLCVKDIMGVK